METSPRARVGVWCHPPQEEDTRNIPTREGGGNLGDNTEVSSWFKFLSPIIIGGSFI